MSDIVNYFYGAFHTLAVYVSTDLTFADDVIMQYILLIIVAVMCAITLVSIFQIFKCCVSALANAIRGGD